MSSRFLCTLIVAVQFFLITGCTSSSINPDRYAKVSSYHLPATENSKVVRYFAPQIDHVSTKQDTGFYTLDKGHDALLARLAIIESAGHSIDVQYYIFRNDDSGSVITWRLYEAAQRGVRVRILLDDMQNHDDQDLALLSTHPNIEVRLFNPLQYRTARTIAMVNDFNRLNHRMHNKSLTVDSYVSIVGGRNVGNEYYSVESSVEFSDLDVMMIGKATNEVNAQFDQYWNSDYSVPVEWLAEPKNADLRQQVVTQVAERNLEHKFSAGQYNLSKLPFYDAMINGDIELTWGQGVLLYDLPDKPTSKHSTLIDSLAQVLAQSQDSFVLISPYFVPTESGTDMLVSAAKEGREIIIVTNSLASNDVFAVHGWYAKYRQRLVEGGVQLWEVKAGAKIDKSWSWTGSSRSSLHAKAMIIDKKHIFVGSMNWDPRSALLNTEMGVLITQPEYAQQAYQKTAVGLPAGAYQLQLIDDELVWVDHKNNTVLTSEPDASIWRKLGAWFSGVLPIEDQL